MYKVVTGVVEDYMWTRIRVGSRLVYIPSVYGKNLMTFAKDSPSDCLIESSAFFYAAIVNEISHRMKSVLGNNNYCQRAILIFFESTTKLISFYNSSEFDCMRSDASMMTEQTSSADKEGIIRRAVTAGSITLLTRIFGRGTDFICFDDNFNSNGGVHIMGRTARQGNNDSFSLVLLDEELEKFGIQNIDIHQMRATESYYTAIDKARCEYFHKEYYENMRYVDTIKVDHEYSLKFKHSLLSHDIHQISSYLVDKNQISSIQIPSYTKKPFRTMCLWILVVDMETKPLKMHFNMPVLKMKKRRLINIVLEIIQKRAKESDCARKIWSCTKSSRQTNTRSDNMKVQNKNIPAVHAFYVKQNTKKFFEKIPSQEGDELSYIYLRSNLELLEPGHKFVPSATAAPHTTKRCSNCKRQTTLAYE
eukprot:gene9219-19117_t